MAAYSQFTVCRLGDISAHGSTKLKIPRWWKECRQCINKWNLWGFWNWAAILLPGKA